MSPSNPPQRKIQDQGRAKFGIRSNLAFYFQPLGAGLTTQKPEINLLQNGNLLYCAIVALSVCAIDCLSFFPKLKS